MDLEIKGKTALLCASNAGLGLACAKAIAAEGAHVVINGRNPEKLPRQKLKSKPSRKGT